MSEVDSAVFAGSIEEKIKLDAKIITSEAQSQTYIDKDEIENGNVIEIRPRYPNFNLSDVPTSNLPTTNKDGTASEEEFSIRTAMELALRLQRIGQNKWQDKMVEKIEIVKIRTEEPVKTALVFSGFFEEEEILLQSIDDRGQKLVEKIPVGGKTPFFRMISGENIPIYEEKHTKRIERHFLDYSPICWRIHSWVMNRLGLTKGRGMAGSAAIHEEHLKRTNVGTPTQQDLKEDEMKGFNIGR